MTGTETSRSIPIRDIFFDNAADAVAAVSAAVTSTSRDQISGALGRMPDAAKNAMLERVGNAAAGLLDLDVGEIFSAAWNKSTALRRAAQETASAPDSQQIVALTTLNTSVSHEPSVEVQIGDVTVATITLQVRVDIQVSGLRAVIQRGRLTAVEAGTCDITGTLSVADTEVVHRRVNVNLPLTIRLKRGIALLDTSARPESAAATS